MERFAKIAAEALNQALKTPVQPGELEAPPDPKLGDFGFPCFNLAKEFRKAPGPGRGAARGGYPKLRLPSRAFSVATAGPYVNFTVEPQALLKALLHDIVGTQDPASTPFGSYGSLPPKTRGTWVLEYSSPNVAKPLNIYHLRPTALGAALDRVGRFRGFDVDLDQSSGRLGQAVRHARRRVPHLRQHARRRSHDEGARRSLRQDQRRRQQRPDDRRTRRARPF